MIDMEQMILIAGAGQNVGKTTLACEMIKHLSEIKQVTAIKISGHRHLLTNLQKVIYKVEGLVISEELDTHSQKDSSRFLQNGASISLFIQVDDNGIEEAANWIKLNIDGQIICESGILGKVVKPGKAFFVEKMNSAKNPFWSFPHDLVQFDGEQFIPKLENILKEIK